MLIQYVLCSIQLNQDIERGTIYIYGEKNSSWWPGKEAKLKHFVGAINAVKSLFYSWTS